MEFCRWHDAHADENPKGTVVTDFQHHFLLMCGLVWLMNTLGSKSYMNV
jgi:hypothetical protein